ncbi:hypothetical protein SAI_0582 [Streptococcus agalactiae H36B]|nr:hypothetical protein SAI_0582 [Streptococcus agalactiae H36B]
MLLPPMMVNPLDDGSTFTALMRFTFSISNLLIVIVIVKISYY